MRLSASKIKSLHQCSYKFWLNYFKHLPETTHPKTYAGTVCHCVFEALCRNGRKKLLEDVVEKGFSKETSKSLWRYYEILVKKYKIIDSVSEHIPAMMDVGAKYVLPILEKYKKARVEVEHEFVLNNGKYEIKGFIDLLIIHDEGALIIDYKSQGKKFSAKEMEFNVQAIVYQLAVWKEFGLESSTEFIMLRHPPTKRHPEKHIQKVDFVGEDALNGMEDYLEYLQNIVDKFSTKDAEEKFLADSDKGFCIYVCQFRKPFFYLSVVDGDGNVQKNFNESEEEEAKSFARKAKGGRLLRKKHSGCPACS